ESVVAVRICTLRLDPGRIGTGCGGWRCDRQLRPAHITIGTGFLVNAVQLAIELGQCGRRRGGAIELSVPRPFVTVYVEPPDFAVFVVALVDAVEFVARHCERWRVGDAETGIGILRRGKIRKSSLSSSIPELVAARIFNRIANERADGTVDG